MEIKTMLHTALSMMLLAMGGTAGAANPHNSTPVLVSCSGADISIAGATCLGFFSGNLNGNSPSINDVNSALAPWNFTLTEAVNSSSMLSGLNGTTVNFSQQLYGDTIVGMHFGNVKGANGVKSNNVTAFYRFDAGNTTGIDSFTTTFGSLSNATLYTTGTPGVVPEPETYAMLMAGLGLLGFMARRRQRG